MAEGNSKLEKLFTQKKIDSERIKLKEKYKYLFNYDLTDDQFLDYEESSNFKRRVYEKVFKEESTVCETYEEVLQNFEGKYKKLIDFGERYVVLFYMDGKYGGGVRVQLNDVFQCILSKLNDLSVDLLVVAPDFSYGFCIEVEEHNFLFTKWGF